jgi:hypothetical protein
VEREDHCDDLLVFLRGEQPAGRPYRIANIYELRRIKTLLKNTKPSGDLLLLHN